MELKLEHLTKVYGNGVRALDDVNAVLTPGVHGILGHNGAGKSTLMNLLTFNLKPTEGDILWEGQSILQHRAAYSACLGYMPQEQAMYPSFTAEEYLSYMASLHGMRREEKPAAIREALDRVGLGEVAGRRISALSGGMRQRLFLAQAVLHHPKVLILDEPTAGLDPYQRIAIRNLISELSSDCIILLATHVVTDIEVIAEDILLLRQGKLLHQDTADHLCQSLEGKVFELVLPGNTPPAGLLVSNLRRQLDGRLAARVISDETPEGYEWRPVEPTLEDVFLYEAGEAV